jgi:hypothetical protein
VLSTAPDLRIAVRMYDVDLFDTPAATVRKIHAKGRRAICYIDAGTWERWRPDAARFPAFVRGKSNGWPGERWLDVRRLDVLGPIIRARIDLCKRKGFDGVDFDNVDGYSNRTGFPLTAADQLAYDTWLANRAHQRGLAVGLKNDRGQIRALLPYFDLAVDEQCFRYADCALLKPFVAAGKPVFEIEYGLSPSRFCLRANTLGFNAVAKRLSLDNHVTFCS